MRAAASDLDFEEAARLRDEIKRLRQTELAVVDNPTVRNVMIGSFRSYDHDLACADDSTGSRSTFVANWFGTTFQNID